MSKSFTLFSHILSFFFGVLWGCVRRRLVYYVGVGKSSQYSWGSWNVAACELKSTTSK